MQNLAKIRELKMKSFDQYVKLREEEMAADASINPVGDDNSVSLNRIMEIAWKAHQSETKRFLKRLAAIDPQIGDEYDKLTQGDDDAHMSSPKEKEQIVPSIADMGDSSDQFES